MCIKKRTFAKSRDERIISREEEAQIVTLLRGAEINQRKPYYSDVADLVEVMINTGLRKLEASELLYKDVNFTDNLIIIRGSMGVIHRRVPMTKRVTTILQSRQEVDQLKPFTLNEMQIHMAWTWIRNQMGLRDDKGFVLYALRRTCAFRMMKAKIDMETVQELLTSRCITSNRRLAPTPVHTLSKAAVKLEEWLE